VAVDEGLFGEIDSASTVLLVLKARTRITVSLSSGEIAQCRDQLRRATLVQLSTYCLVIYYGIGQLNVCAHR
jgi:hypothetical protein